MKIRILVVILVLLAFVSTDAVASENEPPLVDAGLDQTVERGSTVLLDGTGSRDPDGEIESYRWTVTAPDGTTVSPDDSSEPKTRFSADQRGRYEVTLTVTDDDGRRSDDTLYVTVERGAKPAVSLSGPGEPEVGSERTYTASVEPGAAPLDRVVWILDGATVARRDLSAEQETDAFSNAFGTTTERNLTVVVHDEDGQSASATQAVTPESASSSEPSGETDSSLAERRSPTVDGEQIVTGEEPLTAEYDLSGLSSGDVRSVRWYDETGPVERGKRVETEWEPGDHELHAAVTYRDGSRDIAKFDDGTTRVVADPAPELSLDNLSTTNLISGETVATDGYGNLEDVEIRVGDDPIERWKQNGTAVRDRESDRHELGFETEDVDFGSEYRLTVVARDARGQETTVEREVTPTGTPEIVESRFVNTPVDSYHERIDPERYTAKHVLKIDLNGVSRDDLEWKYRPGEQEQLKKIGETSTTYTSHNDGLVIKSSWAGHIPGTHYMSSYAEYTGNNGDIVNADKSTDSLHVESSPPELRLDILDDGTPRQVTEWGITVDVSDSFDPDGTDLKYVWGAGATPIKPDNQTAKFRSFRRASITLTDGYGNSVTRHDRFHQYYAPEIASVEPIEKGPYGPNDTIRYRVQTEKYAFSKNTYKVRLALTLNDVPGEVTNWKKFRDNATKTAEIDRWWVGGVEVPARAVRDENDGRLEVYGKDKPNQARTSTSLPSVTVLENASSVKKDVLVSDLEYVVEKPKISRVRTESHDKRDEYLADGYSLEETRNLAPEFTIEKRVKVKDAVYETETESFRHPSHRRQFINMKPEWEDSGTKTIVKERTRTETEWRDKKAGKGTFTGETRRVESKPPQYRVKKQFEYDRTVEKTGERTVKRPKTITVREKRTRMVRRCTFGFCRKVPETYTVPVKKTVRVPTTETYTYTTTETETYWSFSKQQPSHSYTGESKRVKIADAEYKTQYQYEFEETYEERETMYVASREVQVEPAQFEWQEHVTTDNRLFVNDITKKKQFRLGSVKRPKEWTLTKEVGTRRVTADSYEDESDVVETRANVVGTTEHRLFNPETGRFVVDKRTPFSEDYTSSKAESETEVSKNITHNQDQRCSPEKMNIPRCR
ncbi:PKD domain-containing protein [Halegenticoccus tardaugens]|uniref:PKD domain-containing protein n=1 Tax=Halegenticoccus tardaugens TaxID=2071624 RepID=UPI00100A3589|nr:PKD domain-containing protein [Halegenticoccus tardaugens]